MSNAFPLFLLILTLPTTGWICMLLVGLCLPVRGKNRKKVREIKKIAVLIPAHNEEMYLPRAIESVQRAEGSKEILVIADNCSDQTAEVASQMGVSVIERSGFECKGKSYALACAFRQSDFDAYIVIDADSTVDPDMICRVQEALEQGFDVVQVRYGILNPFDNFWTKMTHLGFLVSNFLTPLAKNRLGISAGIFGNGFAMTREVIATVPFDCHTLVEDFSWHEKLSASGYRVQFLTNTWVQSLATRTLKGNVVQRMRWEWGHFFERLKARKVRLPLTHYLLVLGVVGYGYPLYALFSLSLLGCFISLAIYLGGGGRRELFSLVQAPFFLLFKVGVFFTAFFKTKQVWVRTPRE